MVGHCTGQHGHAREHALQECEAARDGGEREDDDGDAGGGDAGGDDAGGGVRMTVRTVIITVDVTPLTAASIC